MLSISPKTQFSIPQAGAVPVLVDGDQVSEEAMVTVVVELGILGYRPEFPVRVFSCRNRFENLDPRFATVKMVPVGKDMADVHMILECQRLLSCSSQPPLKVALISDDGIFSSLETALGHEGSTRLLRFSRLGKLSQDNVLLVPAGTNGCSVSRKAEDRDERAENTANKKTESCKTSKTQSSSGTLRTLEKYSRNWYRRQHLLHYLENNPASHSAKKLEQVLDGVFFRKSGDLNVPQILAHHPFLVKETVNHSPHYCHQKHTKS